jgi:hypothetical protein
MFVGTLLYEWQEGTVTYATRANQIPTKMVAIAAIVLTPFHQESKVTEGFEFNLPMCQVLTVLHYIMLCRSKIIFFGEVFLQ